MIKIIEPGGPRDVLSLAETPEGLSLNGSTAVMNIAGSGSTVYVCLTSSPLPSGITAHDLPNDPHYNVSSPKFEVIYRYDRAPDGSLSNPMALTAFETGQSTPVGGAYFGQTPAAKPGFIQSYA